MRQRKPICLCTTVIVRLSAQPRTTIPWRTSYWLTIVLLVSSTLSKVNVGDAVSAGDVGFSAAAAYCLSVTLVGRRRVAVTRWTVAAAAILIWCFLSVLAAALLGPVDLITGVVTTSSIRSLARLVGFVTGSVIIASVLAPRNHAQAVVCAVQRVSGVLGAGGLMVYVAHWTIGTLPFAGLLLGGGAGVSTSFASGGTSFARVQLYFSEPSLYGSFMALGAVFLVCARIRGYDASIPTIVLALTGTALSLSPTAYLVSATGLAIAGMGVIRSSRARRASARNRVLLGGLVVVALFGPFGSLASGVVIDRIARIPSGADQSAEARLRASWEVPLRISEHSPLIGAGLGNVEVFAYENQESLQWWHLLRESPSGWSTFAWMLGGSGIVGVALLVGLLVSASGGGRQELSLALAVFLLGSATFLEPLPWCIMLLSPAVRGRPRKVAGV